MRRCAFHVRIAVLPYHEMPVADSWVEYYVLTAQPLLNRTYNFPGFISRYVSAAVIIHNGACLVRAKPQRYEVAPVGDILRIERHPDTCRFKRRSSSIVAQGVITEDAQVCNIGPWVKALGNRAHAPDNPFAGQSVHIGRFSLFERSQPAQFLNRPVRHAVTDNNNVFHSLHHKVTVEFKVKIKRKFFLDTMSLILLNLNLNLNLSFKVLFRLFS